MKETPILFSPVMVEAIQEGRKTMTRREIKHHSRIESFKEVPRAIGNERDWGKYLLTDGYGEDFIVAPKHQVGDRLWVKETHFLFGAWKRNGVTSAGKEKTIFIFKYQAMKLFTLLFLLFGDTTLQSQSFFVDLDADTLKASMFSEPEPNPYHLIRPVRQEDLVFWYFSREEEYRYNELELAAGELPSKMFIEGKQVNRMFTHPIRAWDPCEECVFITAVPYWVHPVVK